MRIRKLKKVNENENKDVIKVNTGKDNIISIVFLLCFSHNKNIRETKF
jgi:hypothetical protein